MRLKDLYLVLAIVAVPLNAGYKNLTLTKALELLDSQNMEIKIAEYDAQMKRYDQVAVKAMSYGKLDLEINAMRSNDAGNVFGFKLQSREATFGDFGFGQFDMSGQTNPLPVAPHDLNYPDARNHFLTKITYSLPIYTGGKLKEYRGITESLYEMSRLDAQKVKSAKIYEVKKAFYDIALVQDYIGQIGTIISNTKRLKNITREMKIEGYAQDTDLMEVDARLAEAESMLSQAKLNRELAYQFLSFLLDENVDSVKTNRSMAKVPRVTKDIINSKSIDIQKAQIGGVITNMALNAEKANFKPTVGAFAQYGSANDKFLEDFTEKDFYTVGVQAKWNLFNGGADKANLEKARLNVLKVNEQIRMAKRGIALKVKQLQTEIGGLDAQIRSHRKQLKFSNKVYQKYRAQYKEGISSISDVLIKQAMKVEVLLKLLTVKNKRNSKVLELQRVLNIGANG